MKKQWISSLDWQGNDHCRNAEKEDRIMKTEIATSQKKESMDMAKKSINIIQEEADNELTDAEMTDAWRKTTLEAIRVLAAFITDTDALNGAISRLQTVTGDSA